MILEIINNEVTAVLQEVPGEQLVNAVYIEAPRGFTLSTKSHWKFDEELQQLVYTIVPLLVVQDGKIVGDFAQNSVYAVEGTIPAPEGYILGDYPMYDLDENGEIIASYPRSITRTQGQLVLLDIEVDEQGTSMLEAVEAAIAGIENKKDRIRAEIVYNAATWEIDNQFLKDMWQQFGRTPEELREVFRLAEKVH